jgi:hypothetical protein
MFRFEDTKPPSPPRPSFESTANKDPLPFTNQSSNSHENRFDCHNFHLRERLQRTLYLQKSPRDKKGTFWIDIQTQEKQASIHQSPGDPNDPSLLFQEGPRSSRPLFLTPIAVKKAGRFFAKKKLNLEGNLTPSGISRQRSLLSNVVIDSCVKKSLSLPHTRPTLKLHFHTTCERIPTRFQFVENTTN